ncbi:MAG: FecR domain-containing protein [Cellvibrio sp.]|uniref:FecR domain-containing protein n=1 Tax=Cellvibrio sp. TaxID=1965322 RepID=UPI0031B4BF15
MHSRDVLTAGNAPSPAVIATAAGWLVHMQENTMTPADESRLQDWRAESAEHERAWQAALQLKSMMGSMPSGVSQPVLGRKRIDRRQLLLSLAVLAAVPVVWTVRRDLPVVGADYRTAKGEQQTITLPDGSQLQINTVSLVDVQFDAQQRLIRLHRGEIHIVTAPDNAVNHRPFLVATPAGTVRALGTRFAVRTLDNDAVRVKVYEHAVALTPQAGVTDTRIDAGKTAVFDRHNIHLIEAHNQSVPAWTRGQIIADNLRLGDFVIELARYHEGILRCDPAVAELRISGVFQIKNTLQTLSVVAGTLPVRIARMTNYWITLTAP